MRQAQKRRVLFDPTFVPEESRRAYRLAAILFWSMLLALLCQRHVIAMGIITDKSMVPTLEDGSYVLVNKYVYYFSRPKRGEVVVLRNTAWRPEPYVKRVIALEGEALLIRAGHVYIDGRLLQESYAAGPTFPDFGPHRLAKGCYFVMGDNRVGSEDSRHFGDVCLSDIDGRITPNRWFAFW